MEEKVAAEWGTVRRRVEQKQQMDWGAVERGAGTQPLFWLLPLCRRFCLSARLTRSVCPPARLDAVSVPGSALMFSPLAKLCSLLPITTILSFSSPRVLPPAPPERAQPSDADHPPSPSFPAYRLPRCDGTYHHLERRCDGTYQHARKHNYRHTLPSCTSMHFATT